MHDVFSKLFNRVSVKEKKLVKPNAVRLGNVSQDIEIKEIVLVLILH